MNIDDAYMMIYPLKMVTVLFATLVITGGYIRNQSQNVWKNVGIRGGKMTGFTQLAMLTPCFKTYCVTMFDKNNLCENHVFFLGKKTHILKISNDSGMPIVWHISAI